MHDRLAVRTHVVTADGVDLHALGRREQAPGKPVDLRERRLSSDSGPKLTTISIAPSASERTNAVVTSIRTTYPRMRPEPLTGIFP